MNIFIHIDWFYIIIFSSDLNLDTKLELLRKRESLEYTFKSLPDMKDGRYKGEWRNSKPYGR